MIVALLVVVAVGLLVVAARLDGRASVLERRRATVRALRTLGDVASHADRPDDSATIEVADALVEVLHLRQCWFEPTPSPLGLPTLRPDGSLSTLVQHRVASGIVLPDAVAIDVPHGGRYVLVGDPRVGTSPEERLIATALVAAAGRRARHAQPPRGSG